MLYLVAAVGTGTLSRMSVKALHAYHGFWLKSAKLHSFRPTTNPFLLISDSPVATFPLIFFFFFSALNFLHLWHSRRQCHRDMLSYNYLLSVPQSRGDGPFGTPYLWNLAREKQNKRKRERVKILITFKVYLTNAQTTSTESKTQIIVHFALRDILLWDTNIMPNEVSNCLVTFALGSHWTVKYKFAHILHLMSQW